MRELIHLPVDSDLCETSYQWALSLLGEAPQRLRVSKEEDVHIDGIDTVVDPALTRWAWVLEGDTREVYSDGA